MIVGNAVATIALSTAGMKVAINEAARIIRRRGTTAAGRNCSATLWSNATASDLGTSANFTDTLLCRQRAAGADQQSALSYRAYGAVTSQLEGNWRLTFAGVIVRLAGYPAH